MKTKSLLKFAVTLLIAFVTNSNLSAQNIIFSDDFNYSSSTWTARGNQTFVGAPTGVAPGSLTIGNGPGGTVNWSDFRGRQTFRLTKSLGSTLTHSDKFRAEFDFIFGPSLQDYGAHIFTITENTDPIYSISSGSSVRTNNSFIMISVSDDLTANDQVEARIEDRFQNNITNSSQGIEINRSTKYYFRIERLRDNKAILSIFNDATFTNHINGSPVCYDLDPRITDLKNIQYGVSTTSSYTRTIGGSIDNLNIYDNTLGDCGDDCNITALWDETQNSTYCGYEFYSLSSVGTGNTMMGSVMNFGDGTFGQLGNYSPFGNTFPNGSVYHAYANPGIYTPCITSFSYVFDGQGYVCCPNVSCEQLTFENCDNYEAASQIRAIPCTINESFNAYEKCEGQFDFYNNSTMSSGFHLTTVVDFGDGTGPSEVDLGENFNYQYSQNGTYDVCITVFGFSVTANGDFVCCSEVFCEQVTVTSIGKVCEFEDIFFRKRSPTEEESVFTIAPNPVVNDVKITLNPGSNDIKIFSIDGRLIERINVLDQNVKLLNIDEYESGIYFISVENGGKIETKKLVKQ